MEKKHLTPETIRSYKDAVLYSSFSGEVWRTLDRESKLALAQELERREAEAVGRKCVTIDLIPQKTIDEYEARKMVLGGQHIGPVLGIEMITLNPHYFDDVPLPGFTGFDLMNTVLHEGRHAFQSYAIRQSKKGGKLPVPKEVAERWRIEKTPGIYDDKTALYYTQDIEMDARCYALNRMEAILSALKTENLPNGGLESCLYGSRVNEKRNVNLTCTGLTKEELIAREKAIREKTGEAGFSYIFTHWYLEHGRPNMTDAKMTELSQVARLINKIEVTVSSEELTSIEKNDMRSLRLNADSRKILNAWLSKRKIELGCPDELRTLDQMRRKLL